MFDFIFLFNNFGLTKFTFLFFITFCLLLNLSVIWAWQKVLFFKKNFTYHGIQKSHDNDVSRLGGLLLIIDFLVFSLISKNYFLSISIQNLLLCLAPIIFFITYEDLYNNLSYKIRFIVIFISAYLLLMLIKLPLPSIDDIPIISILFDNNFFKYLFYLFALVGLMNGMNFIDGSNGLISFYSVAIFVNIFHLGFVNNDFFFMSFSTLMIVLILIFILFNYPFGKIFIGDTGAYFIGAISGWLIILFFSKYNNISSWGAILILLFPGLELMFSFFRKKISRKSPYKPDRYHLHIIIFDILRIKIKNKKNANNLVLLPMSFIWLLPNIAFFYFYDKHLIILFFIITFILMYLFLYFFLTFYIKKLNFDE